MFWAFQRSFPGSEGLTSSQVFSTVLPIWEVSMTGKSNTRSILDSGAKVEEETTNRGAAEDANMMDRNAEAANANVFMGVCPWGFPRIDEYKKITFIFSNSALILLLRWCQNEISERPSGRIPSILLIHQTTPPLIRVVRVHPWFHFLFIR